jgi:two-component system, NarL family, response regulator
MIRTVVVDDHPVVLEGVVALLSEADGFAVVATAGDAAAAREAIARTHPDLVVLDLELPDGSGLDLLAALPNLAPAARAVVLSAYGGEERVGAALARGARSYILKGTPAAEIIATLRAVAQGEIRLPASVAAGFARAFGAAPLTPRGRDVLRLIAEGRSTKEIATELAISERTVKYHVGELLSRLGVHNRAEAVALAQRRGLI